jgi:hypothetical protein
MEIEVTVNIESVTAIPFGSVTITKSDGETIVAEKGHNESFAIPKHTITNHLGQVLAEHEFDEDYEIERPEDSLVKKTDGTVVSEMQPGEEFVIPLHSIFNSDGSLRTQLDYDQNFQIPVPFEFETIAYMTAIGVTNDSTLYYQGTPQQTTGANLWLIVDSFVKGMKTNHLWNRLRAFYPCLGGTDNTHKINLRDPRDLDAAFRLQFFGGWTHSSTGAKANGTNGYASVFITPPAQGVPVQNCWFSFYSREQIPNGTNRAFIGSTDLGAGHRQSLMPSLTEFFSGGDQTNGRRIYPSPWPAGHYHAGRTSANNMRLYRGQTLQESSFSTTQVHTSPNFQLTICGRNDSGTVGFFNTAEMGCAGVLMGLTEAEALAYDVLVHQLMTSLNRQV